MARFIGYGRAALRGIEVDWDSPVEITDDIRSGMRPQEELERLRVGRLRRPFHVQPIRPGRRTARVRAREEVVHPKGAVIFATLDDDWFWIEIDEGEAQPGV